MNTHKHAQTFTHTHTHTHTHTYTYTRTNTYKHSEKISDASHFRYYTYINTAILKCIDYPSINNFHLSIMLLELEMDPQFMRDV